MKQRRCCRRQEARYRLQHGQRRIREKRRAECCNRCGCCGSGAAPQGVRVVLAARPRLRATPRCGAGAGRLRGLPRSGRHRAGRGLAGAARRIDPVSGHSRLLAVSGRDRIDRLCLGGGRGRAPVEAHSSGDLPDRRQRERAARAAAPQLYLLHRGAFLRCCPDRTDQRARHRPRLDPRAYPDR